MSKLTKLVRAALAGDEKAADIVGELDEAAERLCGQIETLETEQSRLVNVARWAQATLTALNCGDVVSGSLIHGKLREVMIQYRLDARSAGGKEAKAKGT